jgi:hypothetical protein
MHEILRSLDYVETVIADTYGNGRKLPSVAYFNVITQHSPLATKDNY